MPTDEQFTAFRDARSAIGSADADIRALAREVERLGRRREEAARSGADAGELAAIAAALARAREQQRRRINERREQVHRFADVGPAALRDDPDAAIGQLDAAVPVAMLPVRIETRFDGPRLQVRIYPDQIHLHQHDADVLPLEADAARQYWTAVWSDAGNAESAWRALASSVGPERAAYLVDRLTPLNAPPAEGASEPAFPSITTVDTRPPVRTEARLLPRRWLVTLLDAQGRRMGRKWTPNPVPDRLAISPFSAFVTEGADDPDAPPIDEEARWLIDFRRAVEVGMAVTIEETELELGRFTSGIARLIVTGVDWSRTPEEAADALIEHLADHGYADGFGLVAPGTASNNSAERQSGYCSGDRTRAQTFPALKPESPPQECDGVRLARALGGQDAARLARFPGGTSEPERTVRALHAALFGASFGFYVSEVISPIIPRRLIPSLRAHLEHFVRPAGPFATLRVGRQPYGVLPVLATPLRLESLSALERIGDRFTRDLAVTLMKMRTWVERPTLNGVSDHTLGTVPSMAAPAPGRSPQEVLADILKLGPLASGAKVRPIGGQVGTFVTAGHLERAERLHAEIVAIVLGNVTGPGNASSTSARMWKDEEGELRVPLLYSLFAPSRPRFGLDAIPWVAANLASPDALRTAVEKVQARIEAAANDPKKARALLATGARDADTLLEGLLMLSAAYEYWRAAEEVVRAPEFGATFHSPLMRELTGIGPPPAPPAQQRAIETPRQLLQLQTASSQRESTVSVMAHIHEQVHGVAASVSAAAAGARAFHEALTELPSRPAAEADHALRGLLDLGSHRLDAWLTSVATRRLQALRATRPHGLHIGGYGIVHDLRPDVTPDSEGYVHVPSPDHAITAAVLRAGHMANRADKPDAFAIRLTSERVRQALSLSEGMAQGQRVSALLGYRFERALVDSRTLAKYIHAFRRLAPHPGDVTQPAGPQEAIAARDVVDGQKLVELWRETREQIFHPMLQLTQPRIQSMPAADASGLTRELDRLVNYFDAFLDLWTTESVFQLARGNPDRAAAALAVVDRQERPPEPLSVATPRGAWGYVQRLMVVLPEDVRATGWPEDLVARIEPGANAIAARFIGDPTRFRLAARAVDADGTPLLAPSLAPLGVADLGASPLRLALLTQSGGPDAPSAFEELVAQTFAARTVLPPESGVALDPGAPEGSPAGTCGLADLQAVLEAVRAALFDRRSLNRVDFALLRGEATSGTVLASVEQRAAALEQELIATAAAFSAALPVDGEPDPAALPPAFQRAAPLVRVPGWVLTSAASQAAPDDLLTEARSVHTAVLRAVAQWQAITPATPHDGNGGAAAEADARLDAGVARIRTVFGPDFPVLPPFKIEAPAAAEWQAALADQDALHASESRLAVTQWLRTLSLVRPQVRALTAMLDTAAWTGNPAAGTDARVVQLPHVPGGRWVGLPFDGEPPVHVRVSAVLLGEPAPAGQNMVGILLDEWVEAIPERATTTSISFQYDAPAACPPQSICLAVDAGVSGGRWSADALVATVNEMFDLARLRLLTPQQIPGGGAVLPTVFIPQNLSSEMPSFDLLGQLGVRADLSTGVLGKGSR